MKFIVNKIGRMPKHSVIVGILCSSLFVVGLGTFAMQQITKDPNIALLYSEHGAEWIRLHEPYDLMGRKGQNLVSFFRVRFDVNQVPSEAVLKLRAMKAAAVFLDEQLLFTTDSSPKNWKNVFSVDLTAMLTPGRHELRVAILNQSGRPTFLAYCEALNLFTGEGWEASSDSKTWDRAVSVNNTPPIELSRSFQRADRAFFSNLHVFIPIFVVVFIWSFIYSRQDRYPWVTSITPKATTIRWILLIAWGVLAVNNIGKIPLGMGMDIRGHWEYVQYVADNGRIPFATEGWQMFQSPLFYIVAAVIYKFFLNFFSMDTVAHILRVIPLVCGAIQIELSYRVLRYMYPKRNDLQALGTVIGGLLPMNIYISQVISNESMAGCFTAVVIVFAFRLLCSSSFPSTRTLSLMGFFLGLAILTKITAVLLAPPLILFVFYVLYINTDNWSISRTTAFVVRRIALLLGITFLVAGWYYVRNWIETGQFFIGGWDPSRNIVWWQDPSYRTIQHFVTFGEALFYPIYSAAAGVWDSLYSTMWVDGFLSGIAKYTHRPPWNYGFMLSSSWLSLLPAGAIVLGFILSLRKSTLGIHQGLIFAVACILIYVSAILYLFLSLPIYTTAKATYTLGLIPCYAVLSAEGFDMLTRRQLIRSGVYGVVACWAVSSYLAYFVV